MVSTKSLQRLVFILLLMLSFATAMPVIFTGPAKAAQTTNVAISDLAFTPQNVTIKVGSTIKWTNNDPLIHTLWFVKTDDETTYTKAGKEGLSDPILPDTSWSQTFNETITLQYYSFERLWITGFITVVPPVPPTASFTYAPSAPVVNELVTFDASASSDSDGSIVSWNWNFGDGSSESGKVVTHAYTDAATYNVTLTVTDDDGLTNSTWKTVTVSHVHDIAVASVTPSIAEVTIGENVTITVVVKNEGTVMENFTVTVYSNNTAIDTQTVTNLAAGSSETLNFVWNTTNTTEGNYIIKAEVSKVTGETDTADNTARATVIVKKPFIIFPYIGIIGLILLIIALILLALGAYIYIKRKRIPKS